MTDSILELTVRNHPGVMANITGLFARRAFNLEGILCAPLPETETSRIFISLTARTMWTRSSSSCESSMTFWMYTSSTKATRRFTAS